uniref:ubiquitinyl hydrolase 1 n=1 Tax=Cacopsylla melanoneura TaxID=428564 RepID=A0A8D8UMU7_9HEMI
MTRRHNIVDSVDTYVCKAKGYAKLKDCNCDGCKMDAKRKTLKKGQHYFVLCENVVAANLNSSSIPLKQTLHLGTIVIGIKKVDNNKVGVSISEYEKAYSKLAGKIWVCPLISLCLAEAEIIPYILPIPSQCRVNILKDDVLCMNLLSLVEGDEIYVVESHEDSPSRAVIKKKGVSEKGGGIFFNVELLDTDEDVTRNSSTLRRGGKLSLSSKDIVIASDRIRLTPNRGSSLPMPVNSRQSVHQLRKKFETLSTTSQPRCVERLPPSSPPVYARVGQLIDLSDHSSDGLGLKQGERVIWLGDDVPLAGYIAEFRNPEEVILHLDEPIQTRDEPYSSDRLRVPKLELIKFNDYYDKSGSGGGYSDYSCEKSCQASNVENLINSARDRPTLPSSAPQHIPARSCYNGASAPPRELCLTPTSRDSQDYCDYNNHLNHQMIDPMALSPSKISPNLSSSSSNLEDYEESHSPVGGNNLDNHLDLGVGSMVEVLVDDVPYYGVIRWTGHIYPSRGPTVAGIEMEEEHDKFCEGDMHGKRYFNCNPRRGHFVPLFQCRRDPRFIESHCPSSSSHLSPTSPDKEFGGLECPIIPGRVEPISQEKNIDSLCGKFRGIQGHHNSCYLDATLFAMFTFTGIFDTLLFRPPPDSACPQYGEVQQVLREEIVNPLRTKLFVRADRVMHLRTLLNELSSVSGLTTEEKDPEEFLTSLVSQILRAEPFLKLSSGQEAFHYQLFVEKDEKLKFPTVQQLFEQSFFTSDIKLKEVPPCLIIQMPRFGKSYKMYPRILPSQYLDITDVLEDSPRQCTICGNLAQFECRKCIDQCDIGLQSIWYCRPCLEKTHSQKRTDHESCWRTLEVSDYFQYTAGTGTECNVPRLFMELFAVVCIETSHYVAFVKGGSGCDAPWCFFDSMADRKGERNGYNIPEMVSLPELPYWLSDKGSHYLNSITDDRQLPEHAKRLMCDAYMVMYQSTDVMMYR